MPLDIRFMSGNTSLEEADGVLLGCPLEDPLLWRKGAAEFPQALREVSRHFDSYHPALDRDLSRCRICDAGDVDLKGSDEIGMNAAFSKIEEAAFSYLQKDKFLLSVGGSHVITYPLLRAALKRYPDLRVVSIGAGHYFEAHKTVDDESCLYHVVKDFLPRESLAFLGVRMGTGESYQKNQRRHRHIPPRVKKGLIERLPKLYHRPVYLTLDLNVLDPSLVPGATHPMWGGIHTLEWMETLSLLQGVSVVAMDISGISVPLDPSAISTIHGVLSVKECFLHFLPQK